MRYFLWIIFFLFVILRILNYLQTRPNFSDATLIRISSKVSQEPVRYQNSQFLRLNGFGIHLPSYPEIYYGDYIVVEGKVVEDEIKGAKLIELRREKSFLYEFRKKIIDFYLKNLPQPHSSLIAGITLGSKESIPFNFWQVLKKSGTLHVVVASGMNVTLITKFLISVLVIWLPRTKAIPLALVGICFYSILAGFEAPILRASLMASLVFVAQMFGRVANTWRVLLITGLLMLFIWPKWVSDIGFWLSFCATASLLAFEPRLRKILKFLPKIALENFSTSLAAQIGVSPLIYFTFGQLNLLSPIFNLAVLWTIVPMTVIGGVSGILGVISEPLGRLLLFMAYPLSSFFIKVVSLSDF